MGFFLILPLFVFLSLSSAAPTAQSNAFKVAAPNHVQHLIYAKAKEQNEKKGFSTILSRPSHGTLGGTSKAPFGKYTGRVVNIQILSKGLSSHELAFKIVKNDLREFAKTLSTKSSKKTVKAAHDESLLPAHKGISSKRTTVSPAEIDLAAYQMDSIFNKELSRSSSLTVSARQGTKLTLEECSSTAECAGDRTCVQGRCIPPGGLLSCNTNIDCVTPGEVCARDSNGDTFCVSETVTNTPSPTPSPTPDEGKLTFEECSSTAECVGDRTCVQGRCIPPGGILDCNDNSDCTVPGEVCARDASGNTICVSKKVTEGGGMKLTFEECSTTSECAGGRVCLEPVGREARCVPAGGFIDCSASSLDCTTPGEVCSRDWSGDANCVSGNVTTPGVGTKLTFEECSSTSECAVDRTCVEPAGREGRCIPTDGFLACGSNTDCTSLGELCASDWSGNANCVSAEVTTLEPTPSPSPTTGGGTKLTFEVCSSTSECAGDRTCVEPPGLPGRCIPAGGFIDCESNSDCTTPGEVCARDSNGVPKCFSEKVTTPASGGDGDGDGEGTASGGDGGGTTSGTV